MENNPQSFQTPLLEKVQIFATKTISSFPDNIVYHDIKFAHRLIKNVEKIARGEGFNDDKLEKVLILAWFVATGYGNQDIDIKDGEFIGNLEKVAIHNAKKFFEKNPINPKRQEEILNELEQANILILDKTPCGSVLVDATLMDITKGKINKRLKSIYEELLLKDVSLSKKGYYETIINLMKKFSCYTNYGQKEIQPKIIQIIQDLQKEKKNIEKQENIVLEQELGISDQELKSLKKSLKTIKGRDDRGIQTMFRTTSKNHYTLNEMVDKKANIMITVNSIILSLIIGGIAGKTPPTDAEFLQILPILILGFTSISSIIFAVISIRPTVEHGKFTESEIRNKGGNLLFFGNFYKMRLKDYEWGMLQMLNDSDYLYGTMIRDLYYLGQKLERKYRAIRISLNIFIIGMSTAFLIFIIHRIVHDHALFTF